MDANQEAFWESFPLVSTQCQADHHNLSDLA